MECSCGYPRNRFVGFIVVDIRLILSKSYRLLNASMIVEFSTRSAILEALEVGENVIEYRPDFP